MILLLLHACLLLGPGPSIRCEDRCDGPGDMVCGEDGLCVEEDCDVIDDGSCSDGSHCDRVVGSRLKSAIDRGPSPRYALRIRACWMTVWLGTTRLEGPRASAFFAHAMSLMP